MTEALKIFALILLIIGFAGCATPAGQGRATADAPDPVLGMLDKGLTQITASIHALSQRITALQQVSDTTDPILRELRALDLSGWQLHQQQWLLQRDHLQFAKTQLRQADEHPQGKPRLLTQWSEHELQYERALEELRQQRHALERERFQVEARLIERSLR
jgi:hypothetical protein